MDGFKKVAVAALCGGAAAGLYMTVLIGSPGSLILVYLTQLPLFFAGLWLGVGGALIAGCGATLVLLAASGFLAAVVFAALNALPVTVLVRQALLARRRDDGGVDWYPPGQLTAWLAGLALGGLALAFVLLGGPGPAAGVLRTVIAEALGRMGETDPAARTQLAAALALIMPGVIAASWMVMAVINAVLAQGLLVRFGMNWRPTPALAALGLPHWLPAALAIAAALAIWDGGARIVGVNALLTLFVPFALAGLAVLHVAVRRLAHPMAALMLFYVIAALFGWPLLVIALVGLLETWLGLRRRLAPSGHF